MTKTEIVSQFEKLANVASDLITRAIQEGGRAIGGYTGQMSLRKGGTLDIKAQEIHKSLMFVMSAEIARVQTELGIGDGGPVIDRQSSAVEAPVSAAPEKVATVFLLDGNRVCIPCDEIDESLAENHVYRVFLDGNVVGLFARENVAGITLANFDIDYVLEQSDGKAFAHWNADKVTRDQIATMSHKEMEILTVPDATSFCYVVCYNGTTFSRAYRADELDKAKKYANDIASGARIRSIVFRCGFEDSGVEDRQTVYES